MKKKFAALLATAVLCVLAALPTFAAKPGIQAFITFDMNSAGGVSPTVYYRNNTGKQLKYVDFYMTPYNAVNDVVRCEIGQRYTHGEITGPIAPFSSNLEKSSYSAGVVVMNGQCYTVHTDSEGCPYVYDKDYHDVYLTAEEVNNCLLNEEAYFECMWYNWNVDHIALTKIVVTFMDGSKQTISGSGITMVNAGRTFQNKSYEEMQRLYADVYNYKEYREYNQDLIPAFGDDAHKYLEHFVHSGMAEGRQGSKEFDLAAYKANNPDLAALFGNDNVKYYERYIAGGKQEGRLATAQN